MRKKGGAVVRAQSIWPENASDREVLVDYALRPRNNDNSTEFCANIPLWCGCYLHTTKTTKHAFESTFPRFSFSFTDGQVRENPSTPLERAPLKLGTEPSLKMICWKLTKIYPQSREILQMFVRWGHKLKVPPPPRTIFAPCKPILRRIKNDCFAVLAGIQQNHDNIYENTDLEFACNLTSLVTIFFSMDVELQLTPIFSWCDMK